MSDNSRVALRKCDSYSSGLQESIEQAIDLLGGMDRFVSPGQSVLIKPNMLTNRRPELAVTTHPEVVRVLIRMVRDAGGKPFVADSPANAVKLEKVWEETGFRALCDEESVRLVNLEESGAVSLESNGHRFNIAKAVMDAEVIINVPKVKTHVLTVLTAAVKNMFGIVPGFQKTTMHKIYPTPNEFGGMLQALYTLLPPTLSVADGVVGMEGDGPSAGTPVELGFIAASDNSAALDYVLCSLLGIAPDSVPYLSKISAAGLCNPESIDVVGDTIDDLGPISFKTPSTLIARMIPRWLVMLIGPLLWFRPYVSEQCIACSQCVKVCPVDAMTIQDKRAVLDPDICISCCCCHEVCPEKAISMKMSPLLNFIRKGRLP